MKRSDGVRPGVFPGVAFGVDRRRSGGVDTHAAAFASSVGASEIDRLSRLFKAIKAQNLYANLLAGWPMRSGSNAGSGNTAFSITGTHDLTRVNSVPWGASGFAFTKASSHYLTTAAAVLPIVGSQQWSVLSFQKKTASASAAAEFVFAQYGGGGTGRFGSSYATTDAIATFHNDVTSYSINSGTSEIGTTTRSFLTRQDADDFSISLDGNPTAVASAAKAPTAIINGAFNVGRREATGYFQGSISLMLAFNTGVTGSQFNALHAALIDDWEI